MRRSVWARKPKKNAMGEKEISVSIVVKFTSIVAFNKLNGKTEVCTHILLKIKKNSVVVGFST